MRRRAFTLIELLMVIAIMGIIVSFIITAAMSGVRRAEEKATISLIAKLEAALVDRIDAISNEHPEPLGVSPTTGKLIGHRMLAATYTSAGATIESLPRAQVLAFYDNLRAEMPDVFVVQSAATSTAGNYPLNFAAYTIPGTSDGDTLAPLPIGARIPLGSSNMTSPPTGMYGASFSVAAGLYSQLGYSQKGTDGADNNGDGYVDDSAEGLTGLDATQIALINTRLGNHKHKTARSEALYALLVEGSGPLGSSFSREDFTKNEVQDTDGDGLLEFVDAWGEPLQFYRWPVLFNSDSQRGFPPLAKITQDIAGGVAVGPYVATKNTAGNLASYESRETNTLDPNQLLLAPAWWTNTFNSGASGNIGVAGDATTNASGGAMAFQNFFHSLIDPAVGSTNAGSFTYWDRSQSPNPLYGKIYARRAYYSRFLVLSGGQDKQPGVAMLGVNYQTLDERSAFPIPTGFAVPPTRDSTGSAVGNVKPNASDIPLIIQIENAGGKVDPNRTGAYLGVPLSGGRNDTNTLLEDFGNDDITSQNIHSLGGPMN